MGLRYFLLSSFLILMVSGCGGSSVTEGVPDIDFSCTAAGTTECVAMADGNQMLAAFFSGITCQTLIDAGDATVTAGTATTVTCDATGCTGSATTGWEDESNPALPVNELPTGQTAVAVIVDADGDMVEGPEAGDILTCKDVTLETTTTSVSVDDDDVIAIP